jgi:hypothetical protein
VDESLPLLVMAIITNRAVADNQQNFNGKASF